MTRAQLEAVVGAPTLSNLEAAFGDDYDVIRLRRTVALPGHFVPFHTDHSRRTMQIPLNDDYDGGDLVFVTGKEGVRVPDRPAGSFTIHTSNVVHGVTELRFEIWCR